MRQRRKAWPEVANDALGHGAQSYGFAPCGPPDPLEPPGDAPQTLRVRFKMWYQLTAGCTRILPEIINPARETHQRRSELMGRLSRHRDPQAVARRAHALAQRRQGPEPQTQAQRSLQPGEA